jgi:hypothetical protein
LYGAFVWACRALNSHKRGFLPGSDPGSRGAEEHARPGGDGFTPYISIIVTIYNVKPAGLKVTAGKYPYLYDKASKNWTTSKTVRNVFVMGSGGVGTSMDQVLPSLNLTASR